ncbi:alpha/beta hydrolase [Kosakonia arachidis]|nr:alpha/beta fold hydrolase [Kosakonia arachidis]
MAHFIMHKNTYETFLQAQGPQGSLQGILLSPYPNPKNVILIIPGSGPTDRDGNNPLGVNASTYRLLAENMALNDIATLRVDKRGMFASSAAVTDTNAVTINDYVEDVRSWITVLKQHLESPCIWLLGHSEGGIVALAAAEERDVYGLIVVATPSSPLGEVLRYQFKANQENAILLDDALFVINELEHNRRTNVQNMHPALQRIFHPAVQGFLMDIFSFNPSHLIARITKPVLILQGQRVLQVTENDARKLKSANPKSTLVLLPDVNHVLKEVHSADRCENNSAYTNASLPLAPGVVDAITEFMTHNALRH